MSEGGVFVAEAATTGCYGCEVWSTPQPLSCIALLADQCELQSYEAAVYKLGLGVPKSTPNLLALFNMGSCKWDHGNMG